jgi:hypothetical protein
MKEIKEQKKLNKKIEFIENSLFGKYLKKKMKMPFK